MNKVTFSIEIARNWIVIGSIICALYVALGAFGSHGLEGRLTDKQLGTYNTGLRYMIIHGMALIVINLTFIVLKQYNPWVNGFVVAGLLLFSLSLLIHATKGLLGIQVNVFALLAPIGGLSYIVSWILFGITIFRK
ncbi:MAG: hypothetical protein RLZZ337_907 [Bacteroidota bacterium]|jgi:uncharacterized membrane protein YgdD (TMEM256/DUF423 family)